MVAMRDLSFPMLSSDLLTRTMPDPMSDAIWFNKHLSLQDILHPREQSLSTHLGMEMVELGPDHISGRMPVDHRTRQPHGLLHGGASVALAETLGSIGAWLTVDPEHFNVVGLEINANHVRAARHGYVTGIARPLHRGGTTQVWDIRITDEEGKLVCVSRLTVAVIPKRKA
jgi:1,4-dihydroxy-2-naphthoyl-CoA hydrolase